ncbi:MAG: methyltransferase [Epsilonproteobacteria bacterium]|nr:methyltransferase [Campylobacterota bacterium]NPA63958.1 methylated-DNA--[protein]-cysteine S-methyltransferase [Campylobacterota bacterium]
MELYRDYFKSPVGLLEVVADEESILEIGLVKEVSPALTNELTALGMRWLESYFAGKPMALGLPLRPASTPFLEKVREAVMRIDFGECRSYKDIAKIVGSPKAYRAVAMAMKRNPYMIYVPCHRVVGLGGIGGYTPGVEIKKRLLEFEKCESINL